MDVRISSGFWKFLDLVLLNTAFVSYFACHFKHALFFIPSVSYGPVFSNIFITSVTFLRAEMWENSLDTCFQYISSTKYLVPHAPPEFTYTLIFSFLSSTSPHLPCSVLLSSIIDGDDHYAVTVHSVFAFTSSFIFMYEQDHATFDFQFLTYPSLSAKLILVLSSTLSNLPLMGTIHCFHIFATMNKFAVNTGLQISLQFINFPLWLHKAGSQVEIEE